MGQLPHPIGFGAHNLDFVWSQGIRTALGPRRVKCAEIRRPLGQVFAGTDHHSSRTH